MVGKKPTMYCAPTLPSLALSSLAPSLAQCLAAELFRSSSVRSQKQMFVSWDPDPNLGGGEADRVLADWTKWQVFRPTGRLRGYSSSTDVLQLCMCSCHHVY